MIEACSDEDAGSIGAWYVCEHARRAGYDVDLLRHNKRGYDVELISVHHCTDFPRLAAMPKLAKWRIVGGHPMTNNPRPVIPFADAVCVGEGETWIKSALKLLNEHDDIVALRGLPGTIICSEWQPGDTVPDANIETVLPDNPPYLNRPGTRSAAWYVEVARGCPYSCKYCELGHSMPFRYYSKIHIGQVLDQANTKITKKINFYAPDEVSHPDALELYDMLRERGYSAAFSSMRIDSILRRGLPKIPANQLIRVGIDGLSESTRKRVGKNITDDMVVEYFKLLVDHGHVNFKTFFMFGYPWEQLSDFAEFENLMRRVFSIPLRKNVSLRVKWTPFIPQPCTPLGKETAHYDFNMVDKINVWHALNMRPRNQPGWYVENDGLMGIDSHREQCRLTSGDEFALMKRWNIYPVVPQFGSRKAAFC